LNSIPASTLLSEGRVYGGGLLKLEPKELSKVDASSIFSLVSHSPSWVRGKTMNLFNEPSKIQY
jgi:hypothetical protein